MTNGSYAMGGCEPCQVGNQAALSSVGPCAAGQPVLSGKCSVVCDSQVEVRVYGLDLRVILVGIPTDAEVSSVHPSLRKGVDRASGIISKISSASVRRCMR